jgi:hypothetical protein
LVFDISHSFSSEKVKKSISCCVPLRYLNVTFQV